MDNSRGTDKLFLIDFHGAGSIAAIAAGETDEAAEDIVIALVLRTDTERGATITLARDATDEDRDKYPRAESL